MMYSVPCVLIIDDNSDALLSLIRALKTSSIDVKIHGVTSAEKALEFQDSSTPHVYVVDLCIDESVGVESGLNLIRELRSRDSTARIIVLTGHGSVNHGVQALKRGADSFLEKPANIEHISALIRDGIAYCSLRRHIAEHPPISNSFADDFFIGTSAAAKKVIADLTFAAFSTQPVFIQGETGTGKSLCAKLIHSMSSRKDARCIRYQPTFATADLINSDLFGHTRGAFTGAVEERVGILAECHNGTLFLDEIDELPVETQVLLLGVLQDKTFRPVGSNRECASDFRLISATNSDISAALSSGKMRRDFYHRICQSVISIPPLRERIDDIPHIAQKILDRLSDKEGWPRMKCEEDVFLLLQSHSWPGNVRELQGVIEGAAWRARFDQRTVITPKDSVMHNSRMPSSIDTLGFSDKVLRYKKTLVEEALEKHSGNQVHAARELGLDRSTLRRILSSPV